MFCFSYRVFLIQRNVFYAASCSCRASHMGSDLIGYLTNAECKRLIARCAVIHNFIPILIPLAYCCVCSDLTTDLANSRNLLYSTQLPSRRFPFHLIAPSIYPQQFHTVISYIFGSDSASQLQPKILTHN